MPLNTIAASLKNIRPIDSKHSVIRTHRPDVLVFELRDLLLRYSPSSNYPWIGYRRDEVLRQFVRQFTVADIIEANFVNHYDHPSASSLWEHVEAKFPNGTGEFEDSTDAMVNFELLSDIITEEVDGYIRARLGCLYSDVTSADYLFDKWITRTAATFTHKDYDRSLQLFGERFGKL